MFDILREMLGYSFILRAVIVGLLVSLCAALLGVSLVLKRYSMIGDGLSHVGFGSLALATALNLAPLYVSVPVVVLAAFLLLRISESSKIKGDAAIALISTGSLAVGVVLISQTTGMNTDVCNYMFGSILAMSKNDVYLSVALAATVLALFVLFYNKIFAVTFDENFAKATGVKAGTYNAIIALLTAVTITVGMRMMGAMLISSLVIFPALTAMRVCKRWKTVTICAAVVSVVCFCVGIVGSYVFAAPTGASVVVVNIIAFLLFWAAGASKGAFNVKKVIAPIIVMLFVMSAAGCSSVTSGATASATANSPAPVTASEATPALMETAATEQPPVVPPLKAEKKVSSGALVEVKEKMFLAQTNEIYLNSEDYIGRTLKIEGMWLKEEYGGEAYCYVYRIGPGCCGADGFAGFMVHYDGDEPSADDWIEVVGTLEEYDVDGEPYLRIAADTLTVKDERGEEFVSQ
ncbi:hypothetical protein FACS189490_12750 [Clostridia bacterium]|nr:hypothetical protein FACS189490_12750 [Clostridia bacterium]